VSKVAIQQLKNILFKFEVLINSLLDLLRDSHTIAQHGNCPTLTELILRTTRYRLASLGIPLTKNESKLIGYHNLHKGERAFIIGNGPSLNLCDLKPLKNEITFGVNSIFLNFNNMDFNPTYYVVEDILVAEDRAEEIKNYRGPIKFFGNYLDYCIEDSDDIIWLNIRPRYDNYPGFPHFSRNASRMIWSGGTVTYICMQIAYYMGFSEVFLIGFDHSYTIPQDAEINDNKIKSNSNDPNHFSPNYFGKGYRWHDPEVLRMEKAYRKAKQCFESDNKIIYNATIGGKLEVFQRVDYSDLF